MNYICEDMSFQGYDGDKGAMYESCVTITKFDLQSCDMKLEYRVGTSLGTPSRSYGCTQSASSIPKFCTKSILFIRITATHENPSSVEYNITSGAEVVIDRDHDEFGGKAVWLGPVIVVAVLLTVVILVLCIRKKRAARRESHSSDVDNSTHHQSISTSHQHGYMYTPVNQTIIPPPGVPQQGDNPQTNSAAQSKNFHHQPNEQGGNSFDTTSQFNNQPSELVANPSVPPIQLNTQERENNLPSPSYGEVL